MATTLGNIKTLVNDRRRDTSSASINMDENGFRAINGALQIWNQQHDWPWQIETMTFNYNPQITTYKIDPELNYKAPVNIFPQLTTDSKTVFNIVSDAYFNPDTIDSNKFAVRVTDQKVYLRTKYAKGSWGLLNNATAYNSSGTWVGTGGITNVGTNPYEGLNGVGSVSFNIDGTTGALSNNSFVSVDASRYYQRSGVYFNIFFTTVANFTSLTLKVGSDTTGATDYIIGTITTDYLGEPLVAGWNKVKLEWNGLTTMVGSVDASAINYVSVGFAFSVNPDSAMNLVQNFFFSENIPLVFQYYSNNMVYDASDSSQKIQYFNDATANGDQTMWSDTWDYVNEAFINSAMEIVSWMTGEYEDRDVAIQRIGAIVQPLKDRLPSRRRYPETMLMPDTNGPQGRGPYWRNYGGWGNYTY